MISVEIELLLRPGQTYPQYSTNLYNEHITVTQQHEQRIARHCGQVEHHIKLHLWGKTQQETIMLEQTIIRDQCIAVNALWIEGILIAPEYLAALGQFIPQYRQDFLEHCRQQSITVDPGPLNIKEFWHNGEWCVDVQNFWNKYSQLRKKDSTDFTGNSSAEINENLSRLKQLL